MEKISPGVYVGSDGTLHLDVPELLEHYGYPDTPANREQLSRAAVNVFKARYPKAPVCVVEVHL